MNNTNTGGPAFAKQLECNRDGYAVTGGMTLRDYFAAKAMQGLIGGIESGKEHQIALVPSAAYAVADAMLKAREA
jgi:hypothetical protein